MCWGLILSYTFNRRRHPLINEEGEDASGEGDGSEKKSSSFQLCAQFALICACTVILFFGLTVTAVGLWGYQTQKMYLTIVENNSELTRLPFSMMVTGVFVSVLGLIGLSGSIFSRTITGQTLLGVFSFVLVLVIISEVGAGAAAIKLKFDLRALFVRKAVESQLLYGNDTTITKNWNEFQKRFGCCGADGFENGSPYYRVFYNDSVPMSCCSCKNNTNSGILCDCETYVKNATVYEDQIYSEGCPAAVLGSITERVTVIAIIAIVIGTTQLLAVCLAILVAYMSSKLEQEKDTYSYNKLLQQEDNGHAATPS